MVKLEYIITGTGRCGTLGTALWLSSHSIPCGHEAVFTSNGIDKQVLSSGKAKQSYISRYQYKDWLEGKTLRADSSYMAAPFLQDFDSKIIHVIRNPLKVITSFVKTFGYFWSEKPSNDYESFIFKHLPELSNKMKALDRATIYYLDWNEMIFKKCKNKSAVVFNIEQGPEVIRDFVGVKPHDKEFFEISANAGTKVRRITHKIYPYKIEDIPSKEIRERLESFITTYFDLNKIRIFS